MESLTNILKNYSPIREDMKIKTSGKGKLFDIKGEVIEVKPVTKKELLTAIEMIYTYLSIFQVEPKRFSLDHETYQACQEMIERIDDLGINSEAIRWRQRPGKWKLTKSEYNKLIKAGKKYGPIQGLPTFTKQKT